MTFPIPAEKAAAHEVFCMRSLRPPWPIAVVILEGKKVV